MTILAAVILGLIQAVTEFLPVSSSGHLALAQQLFSSIFDLKKVPISFDVMVHFATLIVTALYVREDIVRILKGIVSGDQWSRRIALAVIVASVPAGIIGLTLKDLIEESFHSLSVVACGLILTSIFLETAQRKKAAESAGTELDKNSGFDTDWEPPSIFQALLIGLAQAVSISPGVSRSGSTICTALILGMKARSAVHFSFLMSLPVIFGATLLQTRELMALPSNEIPAYLAAFCATIAGGWFSIKFLVAAVRNINLRPFAVYTLTLGIICLIISGLT